jgi:glycosyltransferase involved in cell wall biosynthesis
VRVDDPSEIDRVRVRYGLSAGRPYVLAFGAADPRKNTRRILRAWAGLDLGVRERTGLLIVGLQGPILEELRAEARAIAPEGACVLAGFAEESDLPALMSGAEALCYPSLSEGFGLPVLDAFACGTPVLTSTTTSLPEVAGEAALLVDPMDTDAIREALRQMVTRPDVRETLRARGTERLELFSWERCAKTAASVLAEAA